MHPHLYLINEFFAKKQQIVIKLLPYCCNINNCYHSINDFHQVSRKSFELNSMRLSGAGKYCFKQHPPNYTSMECGNISAVW